MGGIIGGTVDRDRIGTDERRATLTIMCCSESEICKSFVALHLHFSLSFVMCALMLFVRTFFRLWCMGKDDALNRGSFPCSMRLILSAMGGMGATAAARYMYRVDESLQRRGTRTMKKLQGSRGTDDGRRSRTMQV